MSWTTTGPGSNGSCMTMRSSRCLPLFVGRGTGRSLLSCATSRLASARVSAGGSCCGGLPRDHQYGWCRVWRKWGGERDCRKCSYRLGMGRRIRFCQRAAAGYCDVGVGLIGLKSSFFPGPGLAPAGDLLSFASPKERKQRKGDPAVCVPSLRYGQPAVLTFRGVSPKLAALKQGRALIRETPTANTIQQPIQGGHAPRVRPSGRAKQWPVGCPLPSGCAEERSVSRIRARRCLSEASSARPRETRAPQVARSAAKGRRQWGRLSFAYLSLAKQRKVGRPPGRDPASGKKPIQGQQEC
jgi:hypothetical protein